MPKNKKRRKLDSNLHHLTGVDTGGQDSLEDCMAEFTAANQPLSNTTSQASTKSSNRDTKVASGHHIDPDKIEDWNASFLAWVSGSNYTPGLLPNLDQELSRNFQVQELSQFLLKQGKDLRMPVFERWLLDSRLEDTKSRDPVLPVSSSPNSPASKRLVLELVENTVDSETAEKAVGELCRKTNVVGQEMVSSLDRYQRSSSLKKGDRLQWEDHKETISLVYSRKKWKKPFCFTLQRTHYDSLKKRFFETHSQGSTRLDASSSSPKILHGFHTIVIALLLRYSAMSGGQLLQDLRGGGMQGAIHEQVFDVLQSTIDGPWMEGFASPFNVNLPIFGSAFSDIDWHFGSIGSFMDTNFVRNGRCCCEANPPFTPGIMDSMVDHMEHQLAQADRKDVGLTFAVVVPSATSKAGVVQKAAATSFERMISSEYCRKHIQLAARDHGYVEGAQHLRPTRYKQSSYDTSMILLQSKPEQGTNLDLEDFEEKIKAAFASRHLDELKRRRQQE